MTSASHPAVIELNLDDLRQLLEEAKQRPLTPPESEQLLEIALSYSQLTERLADQRATIASLRKLIFGSTSEKTADLFEQLDHLGELEVATSPPTAAASAASSSSGESATDAPPDPSTPPRKGHGRNRADEYRSAIRTRIEHGSLKPGAGCPQCTKGKVYPWIAPSVRVRVTGGPPLQAHVWELARLRCNLCSEIFTARAPEAVGSAKYDATAVSMIALLRYGTGLPLNRLERLEEHLGIPLPAATQWDLVARCATQLAPAFTELARQAAQGEVVHNDDTSMEILALRARIRERAPDAADQRTGIFTTGIVARVGERRIALYFTGRQHAGENLADLLKQRVSGAPPPIQMCDGLARNLPADRAVILGNCLAHGRRQFVDVIASFPVECRYVLDAFRDVYRHEAIAKAKGLSPADRLLFHQEQSGPVMEKLATWLDAKLAEHQVEPNSCLGKAITYVKKRWEPLTLFLRQAGAPLDNNICERALKRAIIHRKNSLFYKTENGAKVGDLFMSLIHTAEMCGANPFDYLTELQRHAADVQREPARWMPWSYRAACGSGVDPP